MGEVQYTIPEFIADLRRITAEADNEHDTLAKVAPLAKRAALSPGWRHERMYTADAEQGFGPTVLHEEPDHSLLVVAASWLPARGAPPHDHGTWAIIVGVDGPERNVFWERIDDRSRPGYAEVRKRGEKVCDVGDVLIMPSGVIHSVVNETDRTTLSFHVYGKHFNHTNRYQYDPDKRTEMPLKVKTQ